MSWAAPFLTTVKELAIKFIYVTSSQRLWIRFRMHLQLKKNSKSKVMASFDIIKDKRNLIKSFDVKILSTLTFEEDIEKNYWNWLIWKICSMKYFSDRKLVKISKRSCKLHYPLEPLNLSSISISSHTRLTKQQIP